MTLDDALAFSHYARRVVDADPALRDALLATLDAPYDWTGARTAIDTAATIQDAAIRMHSQTIHRLVAVDDHGRPVGVISAMDFVALAAEG